MLKHALISAAKLLSSAPSCHRSKIISTNAVQNKRFCSKSIATDPCSQDGIIFRQLYDRESCTLTYLVGSGGEGVLIDPVLALWARDLRVADQLGVSLKWLVNTHVHADHITGSGMLRQKVPRARSVVSAASGARADLRVTPGHELAVGGLRLTVRPTPGHTNGCISLIVPSLSLAFTGDALLIRGCGRTDFQEGDPALLYRSVHEELLSLPEHYRLYPAHDYTGQTVTTVAEEKRFNPRLTKPLDEFVRIMTSLNLPYPDKIDESLPANRVCGLQHIPPHLPQPLPEGGEEGAASN